MKKIFVFLFFVFIFSIVALECAAKINGLGLSPGTLIFNPEKGEKQCKMISLTSNSEKVSVSDMWAESSESQWNVNTFKNNAESHGITIEYPKELSKNEREIEVCVTGNAVGEYHGAIMFREQQNGNVVVQMGAWIKTMIKDKDVNVNNAIISSSSNKKTTQTIFDTQTENLSSEEENITNQETNNIQQEVKSNAIINENENKSPIITVQAVKESNKKKENKTGIIVMLATAIALIAATTAVYYKRKNILKQE